jgi:hypothetical protein
MLLFSSLIYAPASQPERVEVIHKHLDCVELALKEHPSQMDVLFVINGAEDGDDVSITNRINSLCSLYGSVVKTFSPQVGWARGRNYAILQFISNLKYTRLCMSDCDQYFIDSSWVDSILELHKTCPSLHAYMIRPDKYQCHSRVKYIEPRSETYIPLDLYEEWLGTSNVIDRRVALEVGGYDCVSFPQHWGFHDAHYGQRLKKSGLLDSTFGWYVDPISIEGDHLDCENYQDYLKDIKQEGLSFNRVYVLEKRLIGTGQKSYYFDPKTKLEEYTNC